MKFLSRMSSNVNAKTLVSTAALGDIIGRDGSVCAMTSMPSMSSERNMDSLLDLLDTAEKIATFPGGKQGKKSSRDDASVCSATLSSSSSHSTSSAPEGKGVTFKKRVKTHRVPYLCDIDDNEEIWYTPEEYQCFKARDKALVEAMRCVEANGMVERELGECTRGLEREQPEARRRSIAHKRECWAIVLSQAEPVKNADAIARAYARATRASTRDATIIAKLDAKVAKEIAEEEEAESNNQKTATLDLSPNSTKTTISMMMNKKNLLAATNAAPLSPARSKRSLDPKMLARTA
mmetsp:Transcript_28512/g.50508  ORF Transcript_28512/g.50508 Transcript_28512/m.50508 type:complete len:293 (-) Transcript_28512:113-991(-)